MLISELIVAARNRYNAYGSAFWGEDELRGLIYEACMFLAVETECIEKSFSIATVIGTQEYDLPQYCIGVKRVTWKGNPLINISFSEDDLVTGFDELTLDQGDPCYYVYWENKIRLRPTPGSVQVLKVYTYNEPIPLIAESVLEIPNRYHVYMLDYLLALMLMKDENFNMSEKFYAKWELQIQKIRNSRRKLKRSGSFAGVKSIDDINYQRLI